MYTQRYLIALKRERESPPAKTDSAFHDSYSSNLFGKPTKETHKENYKKDPWGAYDQ